MMHEHGKSDSAVGAVKPANKAERSAAELVEQRAGTKGNADQQSTRRAQERESVSQALGRIRQAAKQRKKEKFTTLFHHISVELLRLSFFAIKKDAAPGVDGLTWQDYEADLDRKIEDLHDRVQRGAYRALPSRRQYIPKPDGRQRPIAIAALEDKIVQRATAAVLSTIYEEEFLGFSYGFRPKRSQHDALDALVVGITSTKVNWILEDQFLLSKSRGRPGESNTWSIHRTHGALKMGRRLIDGEIAVRRMSMGLASVIGHKDREGLVAGLLPGPDVRVQR